MDNFFELLPFIIGILYFVFGGRKKKKDSPKPRHQKPKTPESTTSIEDILRELTGETKATPKPKTQAAPVKQTPDVKEKPLETISPEITYNADGDYAHSSEKMKEREIIDFVELEKSSEDSSSIDFDLRQAVIYDAVLNRPYD